MLVVATTSIKFNLGILGGTIAAGLLYFRHFTTILWRNAVPLAVLVGILGYMVASNEALMATLGRGVDRVMLGVDVLQARENQRGYTAFESRRQWQRAGVEGWRENPLFGHGVEAFRDRYGVTSHSTPVDLLYNLGLIGLALFYAPVLSVGWRVFRTNDKTQPDAGALILGALDLLPIRIAVRTPALQRVLCRLRCVQYDGSQYARSNVISSGFEVSDD